MKQSKIFAAMIGAVVLTLTISLASAQDSLLWMSRFGADQDQAVAAGEQPGPLAPTFDIGGQAYFAQYTAFESAEAPSRRNWQEKLVHGCMLGFNAVVDAITFALSVTSQALNIAVGVYEPWR